MAALTIRVLRDGMPYQGATVLAGELHTATERGRSRNKRTVTDANGEVVFRVENDFESVVSIHVDGPDLTAGFHGIVVAVGEVTTLEL